MKNRSEIVVTEKQINFQKNISRASGEMPIMKTNVGVMNPYPHGISVGVIFKEDRKIK